MKSELWLRESVIYKKIIYIEIYLWLNFLVWTILRIRSNVISQSSEVPLEWYGLMNLTVK